MSGNLTAGGNYRIIPNEQWAGLLHWQSTCTHNGQLQEDYVLAENLVIWKKDGGKKKIGGGFVRC